MQRPKSARHAKAAHARWRNAARDAELERADGIPDRPMVEDCRQPFNMPLSAFGWRDVRIEPRLGYVSWRCVDERTGEVLHCAASKELLRWVASQVPRLLAARNFH
jgi:hypothetical protein